MTTKVALLAVLSTVTGVQASPLSPQEDSAVSLRLKSPPTKEQPLLRFEGKTTLPNDAVLKGSLYRLEERAAGGRLSAEPAEAGRAVAQVAEKKVSFQFPADRPGLYRLTVELSEDRQDPALLPALRKLPVTKWTFEAEGWGDAWIAQLGGRLADIDRFGQEAITLIEEFGQAAVSKDVWTDRRPKLEKEAEKFLKKIEEAQAAQVYTASFKESRDTVRNMKGNAALFQFGDDGKCRGPFNYMTKKPAQTIHQEDFTFERIKKYLEEAGTVAGREYCLWLVKDIRRVGERRAAIVDALKVQKHHAGVGDHAARLEAATLSDLDDLERDLRGGPKEKEKAEENKKPLNPASPSGNPRPTSERR